MQNVYICDYIRTAIGRYGGSLSAVRADDLGALPLRALQEREAAGTLATTCIGVGQGIATSLEAA